MTGVLDFLSAHSPASLLSIPEGKIRLVIPLRVDTFANCGHFKIKIKICPNLSKQNAMHGKGWWRSTAAGRPCLSSAQGCRFVCGLPAAPSTTPKTSQEPLKMDPLLNEEDSQCAEEEEEVDPRIQVRLSFQDKTLVKP